MEHVVGAIASTISFVMFWPQGWRTWRQRREPQFLLGLSVGTYLLLCSNAIAWGIYATMTGAYWSGLPGLFNFPLAVMVIVLALRARRQPCVNCGAFGEHLIESVHPMFRGQRAACTPETANQGRPVDASEPSGEIGGDLPRLQPADRHHDGGVRLHLMSRHLRTETSSPTDRRTP